jgi:hypothetical protein
MAPIWQVPEPLDKVATQFAVPTLMVTLSPLGPVSPLLAATVTVNFTPDAFSTPYVAVDADSDTVVVVESWVTVSPVAAVLFEVARLVSPLNVATTE